MKELSLNILDIAQNSVKAGASLIEIRLTETDEILTIEIIDNGCGMSREMLERVTDPFCTSRTTRKVGMGLPLFKMAAEQTGGTLTVASKSQTEFPDEHGTAVKAVFYKNHIDFTPLGDIISSVSTIIQTLKDSTELVFTHRYESRGLDVSLDTRELRQVLGDGIPLSTPDVILWINEFLKEKYNIS